MHTQKINQSDSSPTDNDIARVFSSTYIQNFNSRPNLKKSKQNSKKENWKTEWKKKARMQSIEIIKNPENYKVG